MLEEELFALRKHSLHLYTFGARWCRHRFSESETNCPQLGKIPFSAANTAGVEAVVALQL